jgi:hypothetical protein
MTVDVDTIKKRRGQMLAANTVATLIAAVAAVGYFKFALDWALIVLVAALVGGFAAQIWFIAGLRGPGKGA